MQNIPPFHLTLYVIYAFRISVFSSTKTQVWILNVDNDLGAFLDLDKSFDSLALFPEDFYLLSTSILIELSGNIKVKT